MLNVDRLLDSVEPRQFDEWLAYWSLEPDERQRIREILKRGFALLANCWGAKITPDDLDPVAKQQEPAKLSTPREAAKLFAAKMKAVGL